ncbi:cob(I)yrinic acid a,c-diamide adenosyltransferase [Intestinicryptomonas porci]|uniref:Corrinoid adenosyltransferase n=1 Tax=Intestinicryptomonas porci TaxID=2926320 RepID=A0ABU4WHF7_9BACT|nr:cob(I)yrinic acid a,c-diamide adenosyltransferase [Opitutales bacterium CLA-KB-P66]
MTISTKTGDEGTCSLMFGERVLKSSQRVSAYGAVDELCSALGTVKANSKSADFKSEISEIQNALIMLMTELATSNKKYGKLAEKNIKLLSETDLKAVESKASQIESDGEVFKGWTLAGENVLDAELNMARTICRRAEREIVKLNSEEPLPRKFILAYMNRLSDLLYLWGVLAAKNKIS